MIDPKKCIPQDILDQATKVGMDVQTLTQLLIKHTEDAARDWLGWLVSKVPAQRHL